MSELEMQRESQKNIQEIAKLLDLEATIPPIEIGQQGSDQYEDMQVGRGIYNRTITTAFPNHTKMSALVKAQNSDQSILVGDSIHLSEKGGEWAANETRKQLLTTSNKDKVKQVLRHHNRPTSAHPHQEAQKLTS